MTEFTIGQQLRLQCLFKDLNGVPIAPSTVTLSIRKPDGVVDYTGTGVTNPSTGVTNPSTGVYYRDYTPAVWGEYQYRFVATGAVIVAVEGRFDVRSSDFV